MLLDGLAWDIARTNSCNKIKDETSYFSGTTNRTPYFIFVHTHISGLINQKVCMLILSKHIVAIWFKLVISLLGVGLNC